MFGKKYNISGIIMLTIPIILASFSLGLLISPQIVNSILSEPADAFNRIVKANPTAVVEHDEHYGIIMPNGDMIEFSKDVSISDADTVIVINVAALKEGVVNLENVPPCPPPGQALESGRFCYIPAEILALDEPHLAEVYPQGILLRPYNL